MREGRRSSERRFFLCPTDPARRVDSRIPACDPAAGLPSPSASTSARTQLASCPRKSRCDPALRTTLANSGERTHLAILPRVCGYRCLRFHSCVCPSNQSRASARCSLDLRVRSALRIYIAVDSWRGGAQAALCEGCKPVWVKSVSQLVICALSTYVCI